jgi:hypothetical protein
VYTFKKKNFANSDPDTDVDPEFELFRGRIRIRNKKFRFKTLFGAIKNVLAWDPSPVEHVKGNLSGRGVNPRQGEQQAGDVFAICDHSVLDVLVQLVESEKYKRMEYLFPSTIFNQAFVYKVLFEDFVCTPVQFTVDTQY